MQTNVSWGPASIIGYLSAAASAIAPLVGQLADDLTPLGVPAQTWVIVSALLAAVTTIGRMYQAGQQSASVAIAEPVPTDGGAGEPVS